MEQMGNFVYQFTDEKKYDILSAMALFHSISRVSKMQAVIWKKKYYKP